MPFRRPLIALLTVSVLAATAACGSRLSDEERALATSGLGASAESATDGSASTDDGTVAAPRRAGPARRTPRGPPRSPWRRPPRRKRREHDGPPPQRWQPRWPQRWPAGRRQAGERPQQRPHPQRDPGPPPEPDPRACPGL